MKKVLILGTLGFIGSNFSKYLKRNFEDIFIYGYDYQFKPYKVKHFANHHKIVDLKKNNSLYQLFKRQGDNIEEIYHFAGNFGGWKYLADDKYKSKIIIDNFKLNSSLLKTIEKYKWQGKLFLASSSSVYSPLNKIEPLREDNIIPIYPNSSFSLSAINLEEMYIAYAKELGLDIKIGRYFDIIGEGVNFLNNKWYEIPEIIFKIIESKALKRPRVLLPGDGTEIKSPLYIEDCNEATYKLMLSNINYPINIASNESINMKDVADIIIHTMGMTKKIIYDYNHFGSKNLSANTYLLNNELGWKPKYRIYESLTYTYNWINKKYRWLDKKGIKDSKNYFNIII